MKCSLTALFIMLLTVIPASAQTGAICIFSDAVGTECNIADTGGLVQLYIFHQYATGVTASEFRLDIGGLPWAHLGDMWPFPTVIGSSISGISISYGACLSSPIQLGTVSFFSTGSPAPPDAMLRIVGHPASGQLIAVDCDLNELPVAGGTAYVNSSLPCECNPGITPDPLLYLHPFTVDLGETGTAGYFYISNAGGGTLEWSVSESVDWFDVSPAGGTNSGTVTVTADRSGLAPGDYSGQVDVSSNGGNETVTVAMTVPGPDLAVSPASLSFGKTDTERILTISNTGFGELNWAISPDQPWLSANPASGINDATVTVTVDRTGLADGTHTGNLLVTSLGGDAGIPVDMWSGPVPALSVDPTMLVCSPDVTTQTFTITNNGDGTLEWSLGDDRTWIEVVPPLSGTGNTNVTVNVDPALVPEGPFQTGYVTVNSNGGETSVEIRFVRQSSSNPGVIAVFSNTAGTSCNFVDTGGLVQVHFLHMYTGGATASQWKLDLGGLPWTHLGDLWHFPTAIGQSIYGVSIGYGACQVSPIHIGSANFTGSSAPACSLIRIVADPIAPSGQIEGVDCAQNKTFPLGGHGRVNPDATCICGHIPVQHTTWGAIKAMYRDD